MREDIQSLLGNDENLLVGRRDCLKAGLAGLLAASVPLSFASEAEARGRDGAHRLFFQHAHTHEKFNGVYRVGNRYLPEAFEKMNYVLRDFRTGEVFPMDPRVIDIMAAIQRKSGVRQPIKIYSGYRSPKTNSNLRRVSRGVAKNSFHMYGQALDLHIDNFSTRRLRDIAKSLRAGGVGYYPRSKFVHVDTGDVRSWS